MCRKMFSFIFSKMSDYDNIENDMDMEMNMDDLSLEMDDNDVFEDNDEVLYLIRANYPI